MSLAVDRDPQTGLDGGSRPAKRVPGWVDPTTAVFVALSLVFGTFFAFAVPFVWGPDEAAHFDRAFQVASGGVAPLRLPDADGLPVYGGSVPSSANNLTRFGGPPRQFPPQWTPLFHPGPGYAAAAAKPVNSNLAVAWFPNTAAYSPAAYVPAAVGVKVAQQLNLTIGQAWTLMRLLQVLAYTVIAGAGVFALRASRFRWPALAIALLPSAIYQAGVISADAVTNALAFTFLALVAKAVVLAPRDAEGAALRRWEYVLLLASAVALPLMKPTYFILSLLVVAVPSRWALRRTTAGRTGWTRFLPAAGALVVSLAGLLWWAALSAGTANAMGWLRNPSQRHSVQPGNQLAYVLGHPLDVVGIAARTVTIGDWQYLTDFFGQLGYGPGGHVVTSVLGAACSAVALGLGLTYAAGGHAGRARTIWLVLVGLASVAAIFGTLYLAFTPLHATFVTGVQGRYFVPLGLLGVAVATQLLPARLEPGPHRLRRVELAVFVLCASALMLAAAKYALLMYAPGFHV